MLFNFKYIILYTALCTLLCSSTCKKNQPKPCQSNVYAFQVSSIYTPDNNIFNLNDTIYINSEFPKNLTNVSTSQIIDYSNATGIGGNITFFELDTIQKIVIPGLTNFSCYSIVGSIAPGSIRPDYILDNIYEEGQDLYKFKLRVVPKKKGIYVIFISDLLSIGIRYRDCTNASFINKFSNRQGGIQLFQFAMGRLPASQFEEERMFCFRVL